MKQLLITIAALVLLGCMGISKGGLLRDAKGNFIKLPTKSVSEVLTKDSADFLLHDAAFEGNIKLVKKYLGEGINLDAKNEVGNTALHYAAFKHKWKIVDLLVANGAKLNPRGNDGNTPLDWAFNLKTPQAWLTRNRSLDVVTGGIVHVDNAESKVIDILRKHGGKTGEELKAEGK
jgi:hypothetical protein